MRILLRRLFLFLVLDERIFLFGQLAADVHGEHRADKADQAVHDAGRFIAVGRKSREIIKYPEKEHRRQPAFFRSSDFHSLHPDVF